MNEAETIFEKFMNSLHLEQKESAGLYPAVCVAGNFDYHALLGAAMAVASVTRTLDIPKVAGQSFEFMGVKVFQSYSRDYGFYFGMAEIVIDAPTIQA